jgi:hypothetical protein
MNTDNIPDLPEYAADLEAEALTGKEITYKAEEGIRQMKERIAGLQEEISDVLANDNLSPDYVRDARARILPELNDARRRLAEYELMLKSRN